MWARVKNENCHWFLVLSKVNCDLVCLCSSLLALVKVGITYMWLFFWRWRAHLFFVVLQVVDFALCGLQSRWEVGRTALEHVYIDSISHGQLEVHQVHLHQIHVLFIFFRAVLLRFMHFWLFSSLTRIVNCTTFFRSWGNNQALFN